MKKTKLLSSVFLSCGMASLITPIITSCGNKTINLIIEQETKNQFQEITSNCTLNKESTINFVPKQDQELDSSSIELRINGKRLESIKDYKVIDNTITIYYYAMTSTNVNVKANAKTQHTVDAFSYEFINKPLSPNDSLSASDLNVIMSYKDGTNETIPYGDEGYKIYNIIRYEGQEVKYEIKNFNKNAFKFETKGSYIFEIDYVKKTNIDPIRFTCSIQDLSFSIFIEKYTSALKNYSSTVDKYGWISFDTPAKMLGQDTYTALLKYEDTEEHHCTANFRKGTEYTVATATIGGRSVEDIQEFMTKYKIESYENYSDSFAFKTVTSSGAYAYLRINKQGYIVDWIDTHESGVETNITNVKYINYAKTVRVNTDIPTEVQSLIKTMEVYDAIDPSKKKIYINENDNRFVIRTNVTDTLGDNIAYGKYGVYVEDGTKIFTSDVVELTKTNTDTVIEISNWSNITHGGKIIVKFEAIKYANVELSTTHTYTTDHIEKITWKDAKSKYAYDGKVGGVEFSFITKSSAAIKVGSWYLSKTDNDVTPTNVVYKGDIKDYGTGAAVNLTDIDWSKIDIVPNGQTLYLMFGEPLTASLASGTSITNNFENVSYSAALAELAGGTPIEITLTPKKDSTKGRFVIKNSSGTEIDSETIEGLTTGTPKTFTFNFDKWSTITKDETLTLEYKRWTTINIQHRENPLTWIVWGQKGEPHWPELAIWDYDYFSYTGSETQMPYSDQKSYVMSNWKRKKDHCSGEYCLAGVVNFTFESEGKIRLDIFNLSDTNAPNDGDIYTFNITFKIETDDYFGEFVFNNCELQYVYKDHD